ncbi:hypothetical protein HYU17_03510 [Candidatus Woesearchaeota archaeon]|nr:hypothetical protein [Candidatus Woesearchaeota archaeon]
MARAMARGSPGSSSSVSEQLISAGSLQDIFRLVKKVVWKHLRTDQAGLMVGLAELGVSREGILGAYYSPDANTIVVNRTVMSKLRETANTELYNSYCFYILLHEYLHSCGFYDENENRQVVAAMAVQELGHEHFVTKLATTNDAMLKLVKAGFMGGKGAFPVAAAAAEETGAGIEFVEGIDKANTNYIS